MEWEDNKKALLALEVVSGFKMSERDWIHLAQAALDQGGCSLALQQQIDRLLAKIKEDLRG